MDQHNSSDSLPDIERIPDTHFKSKRQIVFERNAKSGILGLLLIWSCIILIRTISQVTHPYGNSNNVGFQLPIGNVTKQGLLKVSMENIRNGTFQPQMHSLNWFHYADTDNEDRGFYTTSMNDSYVVKSVTDQDFAEVLFHGRYFTHDGKNFTVDEIIPSPDVKQLLIRTQTVKNWRHSVFGSYFVFKIEELSFVHVGDDIALAKWSPDADNIAFVQNNDIYIYSTKTASQLRRITNDGSAEVFNGKPDWVYEEEVLSSDTALWWSPNARFISFIKIDETHVREFNIPYYVQHENDIYPEMRSIKYPKSGTPNPEVDLFVYDTKEDSTYESKISNFYENPDFLLTEVTWIDGFNLIVKTSDRSSDCLKVVAINLSTKETTISREESSEGGWWEITQNTTPLLLNRSATKQESGYIDIIPIAGFNHLVYYPVKNSSGYIKLTKGDWEVIDGPSAVDKEYGRIYFIATRKSSTERHLYYVNVNNLGEIVEVTDTSKPGLYKATFSSSARFALLSYNGPDVPYQKIIDLRSYYTDSEVEGNVIGKTLYYLEKNVKLREMLSQYDIPEKSFQQLDLGQDESGNTILVNSYEILPNDFDPKKKNYYPVFFYAYGGPNSQQVLKSFSIGFNEAIASQLNAIVVVVDGRGTGFKGKAFRSLLRDRLGKYEALDQISAASFYGAKSYVDEEKISLFGWSYGGYLTLKTLERDSGKHFKYGLSVAPVTDWRLYDSIYTERYMHTPQENAAGYEESSVHNITSFNDVNRFLLIHGTGDDNVHFQNSLKFLDLLNLNSVKNYDVHIFPDSDHAIRYHNAGTMVYDKLFEWTKHAFTGKFIK
ncbi:hypothetical protein KAFR_0E01800 [Kazachstania africana CBS 2517]|uniref:Dipeptidyl aminopeptidase B n=1 Tax=Kazachstania africana (strain ATCC 22294 / BCRC 22015 / CBS 2517 / CECT 1963 / NBRC 1671 / NRRL Y-8276) TaxID=1071382 RepID=H2AVD4_KAZAF|nr:hypothetical protein KAFR_0E01800 [Kazachstania africana CBS 2517]CCF58334.1 hypothetical protein KAFR_0E01800 [Kazachstania africana CBS 2517]